MIEYGGVVQLGYGRLELRFDQSQGSVCDIAVFVKNSDHVIIPDDLYIFDFFSSRSVHTSQFRSMRRRSQYPGMEHSGQADVPRKLGFSRDFLSAVQTVCRLARNGML